VAVATGYRPTTPSIIAARRKISIE